jgi:hypothetical protein
MYDKVNIFMALFQSGERTHYELLYKKPLGSLWIRKRIAIAMKKNVLQLPEMAVNPHRR